MTEKTTQKKTVALFGGSFNPPHAGHFDMASHIRENLSVDEVWFLFSQNWQKDASLYAPLRDRMAMARLMAKHYPDQPFVMSDIEEELGTHITYEVLTRLSKKFPDTHFVWVMGADNLASFHTWENYRDIVENFPIAVAPRPPYTESALQSQTALSYPHLRLDHARDLSAAKSGWAMMETTGIDMSSTHLLQQLRAGQKTFSGPFQDVADYILQNHLYGIGTKSPKNGLKPSVY